MDFNISDEKLEQIIEREIGRYVRDRVERVIKSTTIEETFLSS